MATLKVKVTYETKVVRLRAKCGVRYWEDAEVNGVPDKDGSLIPCRLGTAADNDKLGGGFWCPEIDIDDGVILNWPQGTTADVHYKVCDDGVYELIDDNGEVAKRIEGYVPKIMCPGDEGFGDYVIMEIDGEGRIKDWKVDLYEFEGNE